MCLAASVGEDGCEGVGVSLADRRTGQAGKPCKGQACPIAAGGPHMTAATDQPVVPESRKARCTQGSDQGARAGLSAGGMACRRLVMLAKGHSCSVCATMWAIRWAPPGATARLVMAGPSVSVSTCGQTSICLTRFGLSMPSYSCLKGMLWHSGCSCLCGAAGAGGVQGCVRAYMLQHQAWGTCGTLEEPGSGRPKVGQPWCR